MDLRQELDELEQIARDADDQGLDAIPEDGQRRMLALEARALSRMLSGEPDWGAGARPAAC